MWKWKSGYSAVFTVQGTNKLTAEESQGPRLKGGGDVLVYKDITIPGVAVLEGKRKGTE